MTIGEVEEFLWSLSTTLEGEIGNWQIRFSGITAAVRVDSAGDRVEISAPIVFGSAIRGTMPIASVRYQRDGVEVFAVFASRLSALTIRGLQAGFQHVVDAARRPPES